MNAPAKISEDAKEVVSAFPVWAERYEAFKGTGYWKAALLTIAEEARGRYEGDPMRDERFAVLCEDAANSADADERVMLLEEIEEQFAQWAREEADDSLAWALERNPAYGLERALLNGVPPVGVS